MSGGYYPIQQLPSEFPSDLEPENSWVVDLLTDSDENGNLWVANSEQAPLRRKRSQHRDGEVVSPGSQTTTSSPGAGQTKGERVRGRNWEKKEEDILLDCKSKELDWKAISEKLQEQKYTRNHKHCADKWYALRKGYLAIKQWMFEHPLDDYWDRSEIGDRPLAVRPSSFTRRMYHIFDAAEKKDSGRKKHHLRRDVSPHQTASLNPRSGPGAQPSCSPLDEPLQRPSYRFGSADAAAQKVEPCQDDGLACCSARTCPSQLDYDLVVSEIEDLKRLLQAKFAADEEERTRHFEYKERKLELKIQKLANKRKRDEEKQQADPKRLNSRHP